MHMLLNQDVQALPHVAETKTLAHAARLAKLAGAVLRYGLVALLLLWGALKFTALEAEGIRPLVEHSPLLAWVYALFGVRGGSDVIGVVEIGAALLMCTRGFRPMLTAIGSLIAAGTFLLTLSFLVTTPGIFEPSNPFGGFIMKDIILLGAALWSAAEALRAGATTPRARALRPANKI
ncbi:MAG TPA: DUF417 family protein [Polyangiaceae bacterium]|jgi:uncharacterized membrane protein YkgB|nr:DUF417 family protein [Polyangiaceae bacterium]